MNPTPQFRRTTEHDCLVVADVRRVRFRIRPDALTLLHNIAS
jgi:hypothetical protein